METFSATSSDRVRRADRWRPAKSFVKLWHRESFLLMLYYAPRRLLNVLEYYNQLSAWKRNPLSHERHELLKLINLEILPSMYE